MIRLTAILILANCAACWGGSAVIDPSFSYYTDRSPESIVDEMAVNGIDEVHMVGCAASTINSDLVKALNAAKIKVWLLTFVNGTYGTDGLPDGWEKWRMKLRKTTDHSTGFVFLCPNNPAYREWKKKNIVSALKSHGFCGVDLAEPQLPAYLGPESDDYGCLCDSCVAAFKKMYPDTPGIPEFSDTASPIFWKTNETLYEKWVGFRVTSVVNFLDDLVNGKGGIRENCPGVNVATWSLGLDVPDQLAKLREWEAIDGAAIVRRVKPDAHVIQTDWPDWNKADLSPNYALKYKPVADSILEASPGVRLLLQTDIGSQKQMRRSKEWMSKLDESAKKAGFTSVISYEYSLGDYMYTAPPVPLKATAESGDIKIIFDKRLDPGPAASLANYSIDSGRIDFVKVDGNTVRLSVSATGDHPTVTVSGLSDDENHRFFHDKPACAMQNEVQITVE